MFINLCILIMKKRTSHQNRRFKKTKHAKFSEKRLFLTPGYAHFLPPDSLFCLITDEFQNFVGTVIIVEESRSMLLHFYVSFCLMQFICDALRNLVPFVQYKKREKVK